MSLGADLWTVRVALEQLPETCRYHGGDFGKLGYEGPRTGGRPRCESCVAPWHRKCGMAALERLQDRAAPPLPRLEAP